MPKTTPKTPKSTYVHRLPELRNQHFRLEIEINKQFEILSQCIYWKLRPFLLSHPRYDGKVEKKRGLASSIPFALAIYLWVKKQDRSKQMRGNMIFGDPKYPRPELTILGSDQKTLSAFIADLAKFLDIKIILHLGDPVSAKNNWMSFKVEL